MNYDYVLRIPWHTVDCHHLTNSTPAVKRCLASTASALHITSRLATSTAWRQKLGNSMLLDSACREDLTDLTTCANCVDAGLTVHSKLNSIDGNTSHSNECFYLAVLYAAGIANRFGPESNGVVTSNFGISILPNSRKNKRSSSLVFGLIGLVAVVVTSYLVGLYFWWDRKRKRETIDELGTEEATDNFSTIDEYWFYMVQAS